MHFDGSKLRCFGKAFRSLVYFSPGSLPGSGKDSDKIKENVIWAMDPRRSFKGAESGCHHLSKDAMRRCTMLQKRRCQARARGGN